MDRRPRTENLELINKYSRATIRSDTNKKTSAPLHKCYNNVNRYHTSTSAICTPP
jgi:hypothetical protein